MFQVYQNEITREIHQILERYMNANFMPAIENLKRNGHVSWPELNLHYQTMIAWLDRIHIDDNHCITTIDARYYIIL